MKDTKDMKLMLKEAGILFAITLLAGLVLGFVYELTKAPIQVQKEKQIVKACKAVFQDADAFQKIEFEVPEDLQAEFDARGVNVKEIYEAKGEGNSVQGYVLAAASSEGYAGNIVLYMGMRADGTLNGVSIVEISETPGLGMKAGSVLVPQFSGKNVPSFQYTKSGAAAENEIDAISGATITTKAVTEAVNAGLEFFSQQLQGRE